MDTGDEWKSEEKLQDGHLLNNAMYTMKIDWKDSIFLEKFRMTANCPKVTGPSSIRSLLQRQME